MQTTRRTGDVAKGFSRVVPLPKSMSNEHQHAYEALFRYYTADSAGLVVVSQGRRD